MKTKEKNVPMQDAVITKTSRGGYMAQGHDGKGNKMTTMLSEATESLFYFTEGCLNLLIRIIYLYLATYAEKYINYYFICFSIQWFIRAIYIQWKCHSTSM